MNYVFVEVIAGEGFIIGRTDEGKVYMLKGDIMNDNNYYWEEIKVRE